MENAVAVSKINSQVKSDFLVQEELSAEVRVLSPRSIDRKTRSVNADDLGPIEGMHEMRCRVAHTAAEIEDGSNVHEPRTELLGVFDTLSCKVVAVFPRQL